MEYKTEQEVFWSGEFGNQYIERNECTKEIMASAVGFFAKILGRTGGIKSVIEFGSNIGNNLKAIKMLQPDVQAAAIEINHQAAEHLRADKFFDSRLEVYEASILEYKPVKTYDMALICGVLIHINPDALQSVYEKLYASAEKYICISEYYNPVPVEVSYRDRKSVV